MPTPARRAVKLGVAFQAYLRAGMGIRVQGVGVIHLEGDYYSCSQGKPLQYQPDVIGASSFSQGTEGAS